MTRLITAEELKILENYYFAIGDEHRSNEYKKESERLQRDHNTD